MHSQETFGITLPKKKKKKEDEARKSTGWVVHVEYLHSLFKLPWPTISDSPLNGCGAVCLLHK